MTIKILVPVNENPHCITAIDYAVRMAASINAEITFLAISDVSNYVYTRDVNTERPYLNAISLQSLKLAESLCTDNSVPHLISIVRGFPVQSICDASADYDLIIIGSTVKKGFPRFILGSVTYDVMRDSRCSVLSIDIRNDSEYRFPPLTINAVRSKDGTRIVDTQLSKYFVGPHSVSHMEAEDALKAKSSNEDRGLTIQAVLYNDGHEVNLVRQLIQLNHTPIILIKERREGRSPPVAP